MGQGSCLLRDMTAELESELGESRESPREALECGDEEACVKKQAWRPRCPRPWHAPNQSIKPGDPVEVRGGRLGRQGRTCRSAFVVSVDADDDNDNVRSCAPLQGSFHKKGIARPAARQGVKVRMQGELGERSVWRSDVRLLGNGTLQSVFEVGDKVAPRIPARQQGSSAPYQDRVRDAAFYQDRSEIDRAIMNIVACRGKTGACEVVDLPSPGVVEVAVVGSNYGACKVWRLPQSDLRSCAPMVVLMLIASPADGDTVTLQCCTIAGDEVASVRADMMAPLPQTAWAEVSEQICVPQQRIAFVLPGGHSLRLNRAKPDGNLCELLGMEPVAV